MGRAAMKRRSVRTPTNPMGNQNHNAGMKRYISNCKDIELRVKSEVSTNLKISCRLKWLPRNIVSTQRRWHW